MLQPTLTEGKIFFIGCCSQLASSAHQTGQTLKYCSMVKKIKTSAEDSAILVESEMNKFAIQFLPQEALREAGEIPRSDKNLTVFLDELRVDVIRLMLSHRWLLPEEGLPDLLDNSKHKIFQEAVHRLLEQGWIPITSRIDIVVWIDFACIDQLSGNPADQLNGSMVLYLIPSFFFGSNISFAMPL